MHGYGLLLISLGFLRPERTPDLGLLPRGEGPSAAPSLHLQVIARMWAASFPPHMLGQVAFTSSAFIVRANVLPLSLSLVCH